jgi:proteasome lid subunit RPN8/RPN11
LINDPPRRFDRVLLPAGVESAIVTHARAASPEECCGLLLGHVDAIVEHLPVQNRAPERRRRYLIDPADHFAAIRRARQRGLDVVGAYHSHPLGPAAPSATDLEESFSDFLFLIVALHGMEPTLTAWERSGRNFDAVTLVRTA